MADKKISALTGATTPLAGTEVLPIVQSGSTVKVAVSDLTAGRAVSATQLTLTTGSVIVASGQGVDFSATSGTGTSELFNDYEEGTWTPSLGGNTTYQSGGQAGTYTKVGRVVNFKAVLYINVLGTGSTFTITGLPFAIASGGGGAVCSAPAYSGVATAVSCVNLNVYSSSIQVQSNVTLATTNQTTNAIFADSTYFEFSGTYQV
jgi:hypothetical protein